MNASILGRFLSSFLAGAVMATMTVGSPSTASAQPAADGEEESADTKTDEASKEETKEADGESEDGANWDKPEGADDDDDDDEEGEAKPKPKPVEDVSEGTNWGVGGDDEPGRFLPSGKTGSLKEAQEDEEEEKRDEAAAALPPPPPGSAYLDTGLGFGTIVMPNTNANDTEVSPVASFIIGASYRVAKIWNLSLRVPVSSALTNGPSNPHRSGARDRDEYRQIAMGGVEIGVQPEFALKRYLKLPVGLALTMPSAQGDIYAKYTERGDVALANVNYAAMASWGWFDRAMFAPGRFGITPSVGARYHRKVGPGMLHARADTKVEIMIRALGEDIEKDEGDELPAINTVAVNWGLKLGGDYHLFDGLLQPGLDLWIASGTALVSEESYTDGGTKAFLEPRVGSRFPLNKTESFGLEGKLGFMIPLGGSYGGNRQNLSAVHLRTGIFY